MAALAFDLSEARAVLARTPSALDVWLRGLPAAWLSADEGPDTFSPYIVVGHLIHGERTDWIPRARVILEHGTAWPFEPFDRFAQLRAGAGKTLRQLLAEFADLRAQSLAELRALRLTPEQLALQGRHPELGVVTLAQLLSTWVAHDLDHLIQVARVMAKGYTEAVGPWRAYLRVLQ